MTVMLQRSSRHFPGTWSRPAPDDLNFINVPHGGAARSTSSLPALGGTRAASRTSRSPSPVTSSASKAEAFAGWGGLVPQSPSGRRRGVELVPSVIMAEWLKVVVSDGRDKWQSLALASETLLALTGVFAEMRGLGDPNEMSVAVAFAVLERMSARRAGGPSLARVIETLRAAVYVNPHAFAPPPDRLGATEQEADVALINAYYALNPYFLEAEAERQEARNAALLFERSLAEITAERDSLLAAMTASPGVKHQKGPSRLAAAAMEAVMRAKVHTTFAAADAALTAA